MNVFFWKIELYVSCTVFVREELSDNVCCLGQCLTVINIKALLASFEIFWAKLALVQLINVGLPFTAHILLWSCYQCTINDNVCIAFHCLVSKRHIYLYLTKNLNHHRRQCHRLFRLLYLAPKKSAWLCWHCFICLYFGLKDKLIVFLVIYLLINLDCS